MTGVERRPSPTIKDVAELAGVSKSLVSLVMRDSDKVSDERRRAVLDAARRLGYRPNAMARSLVSQRSHVVGVTVSDLHNPFFTDVVDGISAAAEEAGYRALLNSGDRIADREQVAVETFLQLRTDGLILLGTVVDEEAIDRVGSEVPTVLASRASTSTVVDSVVTDDRAGSAIAVEHLVGLGHRRIAHITGGKGAGARTRARGFRVAMKRHGLAEEARVVEGDYTETGGIRGVDQLLADGRPPTAVFAANDQAAIGALRALSEAGFDVPGDVSVVGYDDTYLAAFEHIDLTSVHQQRIAMGRAALNLLLERIDEGRTRARHVTLEPGLTVRGSTGPPRRRDRR